MTNSKLSFNSLLVFTFSLTCKVLPRLFALLLVIHCGWLSAQPETTQIADVAVPSATAGSLGKYGDIPVGHHTGAASVNIPIASLSEGTISTNVSLSYHGGGVRVGELASWAGLGWSVNSGGIISRSVRGLPDDGPGGYYYEGDDLIDPDTISGQIQLIDVYNGLLDSEPDIFSFNFSGYTGKFYFTGNTTDPIVVLPHTDVIFEVQMGGGRIIGFEATAPNGVQYYFGTGSRLPGQTLIGETSDIFPKSQFVEPGAATFISSWHLVKITSADGLHIIDFSYEEEEYSYVTPTGAATNYVLFQVPRCGTVRGGRTLPYHTGSGTSSVNNIVIEGYRLREIITSTRVVEFIGTTTRLDVVSPDPAKAAYQLDEILVKDGATGGSPGYYRCKKFELNYDYLKGLSYQNLAHSNAYDIGGAYRLRLRLKSIQEKTCSSVNQESKPAYSFDYHENGATVDGLPYFPHRLSQAIDHWGYYNGHDANNNLILNAPPTRLPGFNNLVGNANRTTDTSSMKLGVLQKYYVPTGGWVHFETEANQVNEVIGVDQVDTTLVDLTNCTWEYDLNTPDQPNSCCNLSTQSTTMVFQTIEEIELATYEILLPYVYLEQLEVEDSTNICSFRNGVHPVGTLRVKTPGGTVVGSVTLDLGSNNSNNYGPNIKMGLVLGGLFDTISPPEVNITYTVELIANGGTVEARIDTKRETTNGDQYVGGLRIKSLQTYSEDDELLTRTDYSYLTDDQQSSGNLFSYPRYGYSYSYAFGNNDSLFNFIGFEVRSTPVFPTTNYIGNHCWYTRVEESRPAAGKTVYEFAPQTTPPIQVSDPMGDTPVPPDFLVGKLTSQFEHDGQSNGVVSQRVNDGIEVKSVQQKSDGTPLVAYALKGINIGVNANDGFPCVVENPRVFVAVKYPLYKGHYQLNGYDQTIDGVLTEMDYSYDSPNEHRYITSEETKLGDGRTIKTTYTYPENYGGTVYTDMESRNMLLPISSVKEVIDGSSSHDIDGTRTNYAFFSGSFPRPASVDRLERTLSGGNWSGTWVRQGDINAYQNGFSASVTKDGWDPTTYTWSTSGQLLTKTFLDFTETYDYHPGTNLLSKYTARDGQEILYDYDGLCRLKTTTARGGEITTQYDYIYRGQDPQRPGNYVSTTTEFNVTADPLYDTSDRSIYSYFDDLGRPLQTVRRQANNPGGGSTFYDVISQHFTYDKAGRQQRNYRPYHSAFTDGRSVPPTSTDFTEITYYPDPLGRQFEVTPPQWDPTTYTYGSNINTLTDPAGTQYPSGTLRTQSMTDADGLKTITYTDRLGLNILTEQYDASNALESQTWNTYDAKQRLTAVFPPGTDDTDLDLIYRYTYNGEDQILTKKIPDRALESYFYDDRNLLTYVDNASLPGAFNFLATAYDAYGRLLGTGFTTSRASGNEASMTDFAPGNLLTRTTYGPSSDNFLRDKIIREESWVMDGEVPGSLAIRNDFTYDTYGRVEITESNNLLAPNDYQADKSRSIFSPDDQLVREWHEITALGDSNITRNTSYLDRVGQITRRTHQLRQSTTIDSVELANYQYSAAGELLRQSLNLDLQVINYTYLTNGMLQSINDPNAAGSDLFALKINYYDGANSSGGTSNGNITGLTHFGIGMGTLTQTFDYDGLNRLTNAVTTNNGNSYSSSYDYDLRGNLTELDRYGKRANGSFGQIDNLTYYPKPGSNRIDQISDSGGSDYQDGFDNQTSGGIYGYDAVGNVITDPTNDLQIDYNYLNLPYRFTKGDGSVVEITYTASGQKLREKITPSAGLVRVRTYLGDMEFVGNSFAFASHSHGRVVATIPCPGIVMLDGQHITDDTIEAVQLESTATVNDGVDIIYRAEEEITLHPNFMVEAGAIFEAQISPCADGGPSELRYEYFLADHLGNNVVTFADVNEDGVISMNEVLQENHYYPFGMEMMGGWNQGQNSSDDENRYRYNDIEHVEELGLDMAFYRSYDAAIGRWMQIDPKPTYSQSPYSGMGNNPILYSDPLGDTVRVVGSNLASAHLQTMHSAFPAGSAASSFFSVGSDGTTITYDPDMYAAALFGLTAAQAGILNDHIAAIDLTSTIYVEPVFGSAGVLSDFGKDAIEATGIYSGLSLDAQNGGGVTANVPGTNGDVYIAYNLAPSRAANLDSYSDGVLRPASGGEIYHHELGHGFARTRQNAANDNSMMVHGNLALPIGQFLEYDASIQLQNTYLRATGASYYRTGHGLGHTRNFNPNGRPKYKD